MSIKLSRGHKAALLGAGLVVLSFFLPWTGVSGEGWSSSMSGWELAAGLRVLGETVVPGKSVLFLVLLANLGVLALAFLTWQRGRVSRLRDGFGVTILAVVSLLVFLTSFWGGEIRFYLQGEAHTLYMVDTFLGLWAVLLGHIVVIAGGALNLRRS